MRGCERGDLLHVSIEQVTEAFAKIAEDFKVKPMQGASLESDLSTGFTRLISAL